MNEIIMWDSSAGALAAPGAIQVRDALVESAKQITSIDNAMDLEVSVGIQKELKAYMTAVEARRMELVRPHLDANEGINGLAKEHVKPVKLGHDQIQKMGSDYLAEQRRKSEAAEAKRRAEAQAIIDEQVRVAREQARLERDRLASLAADATAAQRKKADEEYAIQQAALKIQQEKLALQQPVEVVKKAPAKPQGLVERGEWKMMVLDIRELAKAHPELVRMELNASAAAEAMKLGLRECPGAKIEWTITMGTRK